LAQNQVLKKSQKPLFYSWIRRFFTFGRFFRDWISE
jgi:hypothetical protein